MKFGDIVQVMHFGHIVNAKVLEGEGVDDDKTMRFRFEFISHYPSKRTSFPLDIGQSIMAYPGYTFLATERNIEAAKKNIQRYHSNAENSVPMNDDIKDRLQKEAPNLLEALRQVQLALAAARDDLEYRCPETGRVLCLEEVKYCIVDPAIAAVTGEDY